MTARLLHLWRLWSGRAMAEHTAYSKGYDAGFLAGLAVGHRAARGAAFIDGFQEGRDSTRLIPLDSGNVQLDEDEGEESCRAN
jgi:hypothetical protein